MTAAFAGACGGRLRPQPLARVPDVEDEDVGADEEDDQSLDDVGEVRRQLGLDHVRAETLRRPVESAPKSSDAEEHAERRVAAEQRDGDADEADLADRNVELAVLVEVAEHVERPPGRRTRRRSPSRG